MKKTMLVAGVLASALNTLPANAAPAQIDVLVLYTPGTAARYGGNPATRFNHLMGVSNQIYLDSQVDAKLRMVGAVQVNYPDTGDASVALEDMTYRKNAAFANVETLRQQYGADMVVLYRPYHSSHNSCGIAWVGGYNSNGNFSRPTDKNYAFAHVASDTCGDYVTVHELGHNMGLTHSRRQDGRGGTFPYALGHGEYGKFTTIMAYQSAFGVDYVAGKVYKFSNPALTCAGRPCGVSKADATNGADAAYTLNIVAPQVAGFLPQKVAGSGVTPGPRTESPELVELRKQLLTARQTETMVNQNLANAQKALQAKQAQISTAQTSYNTAVQGAQSAYSAVVKAAASYQSAVQRRSPAASLRTLYTSYMQAVQAYNTRVDAVNKAIAGLNAFRPLYDAVNAASAQLNQVRTLIGQLQARITALGG